MSICWHAAEDVKDDSAEDAYVQWEASLSLFLFFILSLRFLSSLLSPLCLSLALCIFFSLSFSLSSLSLSLSLFFVFLSLSLSLALSLLLILTAPCPDSSFCTQAGCCWSNLE